MKRILVWCLIISMGVLLCACRITIPRPNMIGEESKEHIQIPETTNQTEQETTAPENIAPETTAPVETVPETTVPPTTEAPRVSDWKKAYLKYLESAKESYGAYALVYIDGDDIPELYLNGDSEATGDAVCTYKNGKVIDLQLRRTWGGSYIPGSGQIMNVNGNMGYYTTDIYKLTGSGFVCVWSGLEEQEFIPSENDDEEGTFISTYSIGDQIVSETEYYAAIEAKFNTARAKELHDNTMSYAAIRQEILDR